ncbi:Glu/Leu/Phe/Val dehydrogenase dimerization domain-containing protein [Streptomyces sp. NPDC057806]|uniref:Glu/Leu/Phe/Val dehydrogenase dimerization domain-containing protein n=1 Tax=Streptomyces sp. NPDC057806 TaxID=3346255 RepID=UPI0036BEF6DE
MTAALEEALSPNLPHPSHELVQGARGRRSGLAIIHAIHSTALGPAAGGCRITHYHDPAAAVADALRLAAAMTEKNALAGLEHGGAKAVVALPRRGRSAQSVRRCSTTSATPSNRLAAAASQARPSGAARPTCP